MTQSRCSMPPRTHTHTHAHTHAHRQKLLRNRDTADQGENVQKCDVNAEDTIVALNHFLQFDADFLYYKLLELNLLA